MSANISCGSLTSANTSMSANKSLPSEIYLLKCIESHSLEIQTLNTECKTKLPKLLSQRLPRFMRRRASSHNPKRIPKSIRQSVLKKINESINTPNVKKNKKNKKKYVNKKKHEISIRRRNQRTDRTVLHVWFAKRFQMKMYWNCLLPEKNCTKNERLLYHNSKNDFVLYYLSFYNCIEIDYSLSERQQLIQYLSKFTHSDIGCGFGAKIYELGNREGNTLLYDLNSYPFNPLVSCHFLWSQTNPKLWLWVHISVYEKIFQLLTENLQNVNSCQCYNFVIKRRNRELQRFRLIGPKVHQLLSKCFEYDFDLNLKLDQTNADSIHYFKYTENTITSLKTSETKLFEDIPESVPKSATNYEFLIIVKNNCYNKRFTSDIIVLSESAKNLWHGITENKGHKVGGMRDFQMLALNTGSLLFPKFGFIDAKENETKMERLKNLLNLKTDLKTEKQLFVIRNESLILKIKKSLNSLAFNNILNSIENKDFALINVELICVNRGVPQECDYICVPTEEEIKSIFNKSIDNKITYELGKQKDNSNEYLNERKIIGLIEFGEYSLETSRGRAIGVVNITGLQEVIEINENILNNQNYKNNKIFATFKSLKSCKYRTVNIKVIDSLFSA